MQERNKRNKSIPQYNVFSDLHLEVNRLPSCISVLISNVTSVSEFYNDNVVLRSGKNKIRIYGSNLSIETYEGHTVELLGNITGVEFK